MSESNNPYERVAVEAPQGDVGPLAWIVDELRKSLDGAGKSLKRFVREQEQQAPAESAAVDTAALRQIRLQLHQCVGALTMVQLPTVASVVAALESVAQRLVQQPDEASDAIAQAVEQTGFAVAQYLDAMLAGKALSPVSLFPQYRQVQEWLKAERIHPADLWPFAWHWLDIPLASGPSVAFDADARAQLDHGVLQLMRGAPCTPELPDLCAGLARTSGDAHAKTLWVLGAAFFEALRANALTVDNYVKRSLPALLMQFNATARGGAMTPERLARDLLFFSAQSRASTIANNGYLNAVRSRYSIEDAKPVDYLKPSLGLFDPAVLNQARKRIAAVKESWTALTDGDVERMKSVNDQFALVADSIVRLHPASAEFASTLMRCVDSVVRGNKVPTAEQGMEVATAILYLEAALEDMDPQDAQLTERTGRLSQRLANVFAGGHAQPLEPWMEDLYRQVSDRQTMGTVVGELKVSLGELEKSLDQYFRNPNDKVSLQAVPGQLVQMRGVLSVLGLEQAARAIARMRDSVETMLLPGFDEAQARRDGAFDKLGENLGALGFLIDMLSYQPNLAKKLFVYDAQSNEFKPVMGRTIAQAPVGAPAKPAPARVETAPAFAATIVGSVDSLFAPEAQPPVSELPMQAGVRTASAAAKPPLAPSQAFMPTEIASFDFDLKKEPEILVGSENDATKIEAIKTPAATVTDDAAFDFLLTPSPALAPSATALQPTELMPLAADPIRHAPQVVSGVDKALGAEAAFDFLFTPAAVPESSTIAPQVAATPLDLEPAVPGLGTAASVAASAVAATVASHAPVTSAPPQTAAPNSSAGSVPAPAAMISPSVELDPEIRDIFLEEAAEVLLSGQEAVSALRANPSQTAELTTVRRAFHTLKGSSRMVGFTVFGEAAWALEQVLNTWLAEHMPVHAALLDLCEQSLHALKLWVADITAHNDGLWTAEPFAASAAAMRNGGQLVDIAIPSAAPHATVTAATAQTAGDHAASGQGTEALKAATLVGGPPSSAATSHTALPAPPDPLPEPRLPEHDDRHMVADFSATDIQGLDFESLAALSLGDADTKSASAASVAEPLHPMPATHFELPLTDETPTVDADSLSNSELGALFGANTAAGSLAPATPVPDHAEALPAEHMAMGDHTPLEVLHTTPVVSHDHPIVVADESAVPSLSDSVWPENLNQAAPAASAVPEDALSLAGLAATGAAFSDHHAQPEVSSHIASAAAVEPIASNAHAVPEHPSQVQTGELVTPTALPELTSKHYPLHGGQMPASATEGLVSMPEPTSASAPVPLEIDPPIDPATDALETHQQTDNKAAQAQSSEVQEPAPAGFEALEDPVKVIGALRINLALYNVFLNEADEWSRQLITELGEWVLELHKPVPERAVFLAHSLHGSSATVGFTALADLAGALEDALGRLRHGEVTAAADAALCARAAEDIRHLLHQFAAGFLKAPESGLLEALGALPAAKKDLDPVASPLAASGPSLVPPAAPKAQDVFAAAPLSPSLPTATTGQMPESADQPVPAAQPSPPAVSAAPSTVAPVQVPGHKVAMAPVAPVGVTAAAPLAAMDMSTGHEEDDIDLVDVPDVDLFPIFDEEAAELMPQLGAALRQWTARPENLSARSEVLRTLHTLKGSARLAGALRLGELSHQMESQIEAIGTEQQPTPQAMAALLSRYDTMNGVLEKLRLQAKQTAASGSGVVSPQVAAPVSQQPASGERHDAPPAQNLAEEAQALRTMQPMPAPTRSGQSVGGSSVRVRSQLLDRLVNQAGEVMITRSRLEAELGNLRGSLGDLTGNLDRLRQQLRDIEVQAESQMQSRLAQTKESAQGFDPLEFDRFTRVQELTRMMAESVNDVATIQRNLQRTVALTEDDLVAQARQTRELQRDLLRTRMVEFEALSERLYRVVRQAAKDAGKQVRLDITGGSIEMDRGVLDRMTSAFEHLLRNCVGHGIEEPQQRRLAGKDPVGLITIHLSHEGNDVAVEFSDDGAGLDIARLRDKAIAQGLLPANQTLTEAEAANLIFLPGLSTATEVTELSGRGIGMDVVRSEVNALGGRIETSSQPGHGTRFRLVLPLTTAVTQVVMVRAGKLTIGVPSNLVEAVRRASAAELQAAYGSGQFATADAPLAFYWAGALLHSSASSAEQVGKTNPILVLRSAGQRVAVHFDEVLGNQEVVVKNLGPQLSRLPGLAGMTMLASGAVVLIYNLVALASFYGESARKFVAAVPTPGVGDAGEHLATTEQALSAVPMVMVVDDSITVRRVTQRLLQREGYRVVLAADGLQALEELRGELPALMLCDIEMPRMDGFDLTRNLRGNPRTQKLPIVMITSRIAEKHREHAKELGVNHYLGKPYAEEELLSLVRRYCAAALTTA